MRTGRVHGDHAHRIEERALAHHLCLHQAMPHFTRGCLHQQCLTLRESIYLAPEQLVYLGVPAAQQDRLGRTRGRDPDGTQVAIITHVCIHVSLTTSVILPIHRTKQCHRILTK